MRRYRFDATRWTRLWQLHSAFANIVKKGGLLGTGCLGGVSSTAIAGIRSVVTL